MKKFSTNTKGLYGLAVSYKKKIELQKKTVVSDAKKTVVSDEKSYCEYVLWKMSKLFS